MFRVVTKSKEGKKVEIKHVLSYEIESTLDAVADGFSFVLGNKGGINGGVLLEGAEIKLYTGKDLLLVGEIDEIAESETISVTGRDLLIRAIENDVEHKTKYEAELRVEPAREVKYLAKSVGINKIVSMIPFPQRPLKKFLTEAGESTADVMLRLAEAGDFNVWLSRKGTLYVSTLNFNQVPNWHFYNRMGGSNCFPIKRKRSAVGLKSEIWSYADLYEAWGKGINAGKLMSFKSVNKNALVTRRKTIIDNDSTNKAQAQKKVDRMMKESKTAAKEWEISYGGDHKRNGTIPEPGKMAFISSFYSDVTLLRAMIFSVTLKNDPVSGRTTQLVLREGA